MRIFDITKTHELTDYDLNLGYLQQATLETLIAEQPAVSEKSHYELIATYPNGGQDVKKIIDVSAQPCIPAHTEIENILIYTPYTEAELT